MLFLAFLLAASASAGPQRMIGEAFEDLAQRTDAACPARGVRAISPADLDYAQEGFEDALSAQERARLDAANTADTRCANENGVTCPAIATLEAMRKAQLISRFADYLCAHPDPK
jgi:hypothetical protein